MPAKSTRKPRVPMPPPSPALTRLEAERAALAAAAKSPPPEDSLSELEALKAKFDEVKRERDEAMAKVSELTDELEAATYSEEQVRALLAEALAELAGQERDDGDGEEAEASSTPSRRPCTCRGAP